MGVRILREGAQQDLKRPESGPALGTPDCTPTSLPNQHPESYFVHVVCKAAFLFTVNVLGTEPDFCL